MLEYKRYILIEPSMELNSNWNFSVVGALCGVTILSME